MNSLIKKYRFKFKNKKNWNLNVNYFIKSLIRKSKLIN